MVWTDVDVALYQQSIQKWGNKRANLYWEAHLKAGHVPPEQYVQATVKPRSIDVQSADSKRYLSLSFR